MLLLLSAGVFVLGAYLNVRFGEATLARIATSDMDVHGDFDTFWRSVDALWDGDNLYETGARLPNLNPPVWSVLLAPFGLVGMLEAYRLFVMLTLAAFVGALAWASGELRLGAGWAVLATGALVVSGPLLGTLALGQVYPLLALGLVASWVADRRELNIPSGVALGLVVAVKPLLAPVLLWPAFRRRWDALVAAILAGAGATLVGGIVAGPGATIDYVRLLSEGHLTAFWDNASLPGTAARLFTENEFARPLVEVPVMVVVAHVVGAALVVFTAYKVRRSEGGLWAVVAASLLLSPIAWHNYLVVLAPGIMVLFARAWISPAVFLLALQFVPQQWPQLWREDGTVLATLALSAYTFVLFVHWLAFLGVGRRSGKTEAGK